jgi:outer membrane protein
MNLINIKSQACRAFTVALTVAAIATFSTFTSASAAETKIGTLSLQKVMSSSKALQDVQMQTEKKLQSFQKQIEAKEKELKSKNEDIEKKSSSLSEDALGKAREAFRKDLEVAQKDFHAKRVAIDQSRGEANSKVVDKLNEIIEKVAKQKGLTLVVETGATVYSTNDLDITNEVLEKLNKEITSVKVNFK